MIPGDRWPSLNHRTLAEVVETERLRLKRRQFGFNNSNRARLQALEARAVEPDLGTSPDSAA